MDTSSLAKNGSYLNIAIDGPAGSGKSTIASALADTLGIAHLDTGAMYRSVAWLADTKGIPLDNGKDLALLISENAPEVVVSSSGTRVLFDGSDITEQLYTAEIGQGASIVGVHPEVRSELVAWQQQYAAENHTVLDGRDIGTVVLPEATLKIFLTASPRVRAQRRFLELQEKGMAAEHTVDSIEKEITIRDERDSTRDTGALKQAEDAILIDSSSLTVAEVLKQVMDVLVSLGYGSGGDIHDAI